MFYNKNGKVNPLVNYIPNSHNINISSGESSSMLKKKPDFISSFVITRDVITSTKEFMVKMGKRHLEGLVFWSGILENDTAFIRRMICPQNISTSISAHTTNQGLSYLREILRENNEFLFMQVHSHPAAAFHSFTDNNEAISFKKGFISIVVPYFGENMDNMNTWAIFEYTDSFRWRKLGYKEISKRFILLEK